MSDDKIIDKILFEIDKVPFVQIDKLIMQIFQGQIRIISKKQMIIKRMVDYNLIVRNGKGYSHTITSHGRKIVESGGWLKYLENESAESLKKDQKLDLEIKQLTIQSTLLKWQKNTFWPGFLLGIIGGLYALYKMFMEL